MTPLIGDALLTVGTLILLRIAIAERADGQRLPPPWVWIAGASCGVAMGALWHLARYARAHVVVGFH